MPTVSRQCAYCHKTFEAHNKRGRPPSYCSRRCIDAVNHPPRDKTNRVCPECGSEFSGSERKRFCSDLCRAKRNQRKPCICRHCQRPFPGTTGKLFCSVGCRRRSTRIRPDSSMCRGCSKAFAPKRADCVTFCSRGCATSFRLAKEREKRLIALSAFTTIAGRCECCTEYILKPRKRTCSEECARELQRREMREAYQVQTPPRVRTCLDCGEVFVQRGRVGQTRRCVECRKVQRKRAVRRSKKRTNHVRRARMRGCDTERFHDEEIFQRDGWRCQICHKPVLPKKKFPHPRYPTIDHIIPLAKHGGHTRKNVQCACFSCNSFKRDGTADVQLLLVG